MRASRAGLILTPHRTAELGGPTSYGRQEARPLVWLPILRLFPVRSQGGAAALPLDRSSKKTKGWTGRTTKSRIPISFLSRRANYKARRLSGMFVVLVHLVKKMIIKLLQAAWINSSSVSSDHIHRLLLPKLTARLIRLLENSRSSEQAPPLFQNHPIRNTQLSLGGDEIPRRGSSKQRGRRENMGEGRTWKMLHTKQNSGDFFKFAVLEGFIDVFALEIGYSFQVLLF